MKEKKIDVSSFSALNNPDYFSQQTAALERQAALEEKKTRRELAPLRDPRAQFGSMFDAAQIMQNAVTLEGEWSKAGNVSTNCISLMNRQADEQLLTLIRDNKIQPCEDIENFLSRNSRYHRFGFFDTKPVDRYRQLRDNPRQAPTANASGSATQVDCGSCCIGAEFGAIECVMS